MSRINHVEFLVEEYSMALTIHAIAPSLIGGRTFDVHPFSGKPDLLRKLPGRLRGYTRHVPASGWAIVVLVDEDRQDCLDLKRKLEQCASDAGLPTVSSGDENPRVLNRIVVEELEAWLLGDAAAVANAYPRVPLSFANAAAYRDVDAIRGGTAEALARLLVRHGYRSESLQKSETAVAIAEHMNVTCNRSHSFNVFREGLAVLLDSPPDPMRSL